ncbi:MAG: NAD(P)(+) transhydrogenase (Re/Si-specific) subunit alpha, partial [Actinomycetota bacterium]|nr:NAD(P)(+) transhydrogenase (Re/Si-specific) subunit alpha [Actinomycetota bacterium]
MPNPASGQDQRRAATVGVVREAMAGEWRVALTPAVVPALTRAGCQVVVES